MAADGSIVIDTRIDSKGINTGMKGVTSALGGVLRAAGSVVKMLGAAFIGGSIINGIRSVIGSFDLMSSSIGGSVQSLSESFGALKGAFVNLIITAFAPLIPFIVQVVQWLTTLFTVVAQIIGALFGFQTGMAGVANSAGGAGKAIKKTAKEAKGALATFDQINVLAIPEQEQPDTGGGGGGGGAPALAGLQPISPELLKNVEEFKNKMMNFLQPVIDALGRLKESLAPLGKTIWEGLQWAWENILVPLADWAITDLLPTWLDGFGAGMVILNDILVAMQPTLKWLWDNFLLPAAQFVGDALIKYLEWMTDNLKKLHEWIQNNQKAWQIIVTILSIVALALILILSPIAQVIGAIIAIIAIIANWGAIWDWFKEKSIAFWDAFFGKLDLLRAKWMDTFTGIRDFTKGVMNSIIEIINSMIQSVAGGINSIISSINAVGSILPGFSGVSSVSVPQIPHLATGAVIPANSNFLAMLGDQTSGRNIEAPEGLIRQIIREEQGKMQANIQISFAGDLAPLIRELKPRIDKENIRVGGSLIKGVTSI